VNRLREEREAHGKAASELEALRERNGHELAGYLLPDLDDEDLTALERRLRYPVLLDEKRKTEVALAAVAAERAQIEADPRYAQREVNRIDYEQQLAEVAEAATSFASEREIWERSEYFQTLFKRGWFADDYDGGLFDWLRDWRACSLLMTELEAAYPDRKFPEDEDVKAAWAALYASSEPVLQMRRDLWAKLAEVASLEARHQELAAAPDALFQALWKKLAGLVIDHLRQVDDDVLLALGKGDETLAMFLKKDAGLKKQAAYLRELTVTRIDPNLRTLNAEVTKLRHKGDKLRYKRSRGKFVQAGPAEVAAMRTIPSAKWEARRASLSKTRERLVTFDKWDRGSFVSEYLWWDLVTRGARGDDLYEVRTFHERHPGWSAATFRDPLDRDANDAAADANDLAATATVDSMLADDGLHDAS